MTPPAPIPPPPSPSAAALSQALAGVPCTLLRATAGVDGRVGVAGLVGTAAAEDTALQHAAGAAIWTVRRFDGPYCPVLDLLRALPDAALGAAPGLALAQDGGPATLQDNELIALHATMPGFAGFLHVAYVQHDEQRHGPATASPLVPGPGYPAQTYPARASVALGSPGWTVGPPFGTDMIVAIVSTAPLFTKPPPADQPLPAYLASLGSAIDGLRRRGGTVSATATVLDTRPGP